MGRPGDPDRRTDPVRVIPRRRESKWVEPDPRFRGGDNLEGQSKAASFPRKRESRRVAVDPALELAPPRSGRG